MHTENPQDGTYIQCGREQSLNLSVKIGQNVRLRLNGKEKLRENFSR